MPELVLPAGNPEKMRYALHYGADAVYGGAEAFSLRRRADNFSFSEMAAAINYCHQLGKRFYLAVNIYFRPSLLDELPAFLEQVVPLGPDALIMADPGAIRISKRLYPSLPIHLSTQANLTNSEAAAAYRDLGVERVIVARELSLADISLLHHRVPDLALEAFVHGALCVAYSGRCLISNYLTSAGWLGSGEELLASVDEARIANQGDCSQTCRWQYTLVEEKRGDVVLLAEDLPRGAMLFSSKDLCMLGHIPDLIAAGVQAFKVEGRIKSILYVAATARAYRVVLDAALRGEVFDPQLLAQLSAELADLTRREQATGFYYDDNRALQPCEYKKRGGYLFLATVTERQGKRVRCRARNKVEQGMEIEVIGPALKQMKLCVERMFDETGKAIPYIGHGHDFFLETDAGLEAMDILRCRRPESD